MKLVNEVKLKDEQEIDAKISFYGYCYTTIKKQPHSCHQIGQIIGAIHSSLQISTKYWKPVPFSYLDL